MTTQTERRNPYYVAESGGRIVPADLVRWAIWFESSAGMPFMDGGSLVAKTKIGSASVSTVFMGLDHQYGNGPPLLFETMIFGAADGEYQERYATEEQSRAGHERAVNAVKAATTQPN